VHPAALLKSSGVLLKRPGFVSYAWQASTIVAVYLALISTMPYVMVNGLHRTPSEYGYWFVSIAGSYFVGNWITTHMAARRGLHSVIHVGVLIGAVSCTLGLVLALLGFRQISAALAVQFVGLFAVDTATPMLAFCSAATVLALLVWSLWSPSRRK
jgi:DHA1 family bicyclomycin/chloramphenicol resistance-like MFS transporter